MYSFEMTNQIGSTICFKCASIERALGVCFCNKVFVVIDIVHHTNVLFYSIHIEVSRIANFTISRHRWYLNKEIITSFTFHGFVCKRFLEENSLIYPSDKRPCSQRSPKRSLFRSPKIHHLIWYKAPFDSEGITEFFVIKAIRHKINFLKTILTIFT